jgi:hypothetical protein
MKLEIKSRNKICNIQNINVVFEGLYEYVFERLNLWRLSEVRVKYSRKNSSKC